MLCLYINNDRTATDWTAAEKFFRIGGNAIILWGKINNGFCVYV